MDAAGTIAVGGDDALIPVEGEAWFDHQWGDFIAVGGGGWDWFAVNLEDGTDLTLLARARRRRDLPAVYGTLVRPDGSFEHLPREAFTVTPTGSWTSPHTGATYPSGWTVTVPERAAGDRARRRRCSTRSSTRGPRRASSTGRDRRIVEATRAGEPIDGEAYVELTGYLPTE